MVYQSGFYRITELTTYVWKLLLNYQFLATIVEHFIHFNYKIFKILIGYILSKFELES